LLAVPALLLAACSVTGGSGSTTGTGPNPCLGNHQTTQPTSSGNLGQTGTGTAIPTDQPIHLSIALNINYAALDACTQAINDPSSSAYGHYLSPADIAANFAPAQSDINSLSTYLTGKGLQVSQTYTTGAALSVDGTAQQVESAFNVQLNATNSGGYAPNTAPTLPGNLQNFVGNVLGLTSGGSAHCNVDNPNKPSACGQILHYSHINVPANLPKTANKAQADCTLANYGAPGLSGSTSLTSGLLTWSDLKAAYGIDKLNAAGYDGGSTSVGLVEFDTYQRPDIVNYMGCAGTYDPNRLQIENVDVGKSDPAADSAPGAGEAELDLEMVAGLTGKSTKIIDYYAPNNAQWETELQDILQKVASDKKVSVLSISYGDYEADLTPTYMATINNSMKLLASEGISVFVASGDCAAFGSGILGQKALSFPASAPYAIAVGGTSIPVTIDPTSVLTGGSGAGTLGTESAWLNGSPTSPCQNTWGSGGGVSTVPDFTIQDAAPWQKGSGVSNAQSTGERQVPDVSAAAINISFYYDLGLGTGGLWLSVGGTSAAAPIWAAGTAVLDQALAAKGKSALGGVNAIYSLANGSNASKVYNDVTSGGTAAYPYTPGKGWDYVTGWGSPHFDQILTALGG
jgi:kumamolisin